MEFHLHHQWKVALVQSCGSEGAWPNTALTNAAKLSPQPTASPSPPCLGCTQHWSPAEAPSPLTLCEVLGSTCLPHCTNTASGAILAKGCTHCIILKLLAGPHELAVTVLVSSLNQGLPFVPMFIQCLTQASLHLGAGLWKLHHTRLNGKASPIHGMQSSQEEWRALWSGLNPRFPSVWFPRH